MNMRVSVSGQVLSSGAPFLSRARYDPLAGRRRVRGLGARRARPGGSLNSCAGVTPRDDSDRTQSMGTGGASMGTGGAKYRWRPALKSCGFSNCILSIIFAHTCTPRTSILRWSFQAEPCDDQGRGRLRCGTQSPWRHHFAKRDQKISVDGDEVCVIYDFVTDTPVGPVPSVEWIGMRNGKTKSVRLNFHCLEWPAIKEGALRRAKVATATPAP
jgi:hypothetical protein